MKLDIKPLCERLHVPPGRPVGLILPPTGELFLEDHVGVPPEELLPVIVILIRGQEVGGVMPVDLLQGKVGGIGQGLQP